MPDLATRADELLLLELLNTTPVVDGSPQDLLGDGDEASAWVRDRGGTGSTAEVARLRRVRDRLQAVVRGVDPATVLAPLLADVHLRPEIGDAGLTWRLAVEDAERLAARVLVAWGQVQERMPGRLRPCANEECCLFLLDRSKPGTARWCSMKICGNRLKARRHYERARGGR
ncbi:CGNR zinc finger domain-containing protein [Pseudonocardia kunmingensis]|uniref:Putative RNA-binding Zn ribbon-like protein n=1 Tax=Pseudonocardia kunmingensis TaxID=630975 RepID=A0A543DWY8_9PSEU|nr:CGNR zinc finger domain-containing protein [Pseudonocardia kunmingensis]TQM13844.1 putative RNA-binding Zn ribbon-like protein [Pseudonocardia kunmingensis]